MLLLPSERSQKCTQPICSEMTKTGAIVELGESV